MSPNQIINHLVRNERAAAYDTMREMNAEQLLECNEVARERGFADFDELVSFYTICEAKDDVQGAERRYRIRDKFSRCLEHYDATSEVVQAFRASRDWELILASFKISGWRYLLLVALIVAFYCTLNGVVLALEVLVIAWILFRAIYYYRTACFVRHSYELFNKYGIHGLEAEHRVYDADGYLIKDPPDAS